MNKKIYLISTAPPTSCGIATFSNHIKQSFERVWDEKYIKLEYIPLDPADNKRDDFVASIDTSDENSFNQVAEFINQDDDCAGVIIQHEYGIYGSNDGENIKGFVEKINKPIFTTFHTVLNHPSPNQREILNIILEHSSTVSVMTDIARQILIDNYHSPEDKVIVLPHGIPDTPFRSAEVARRELDLPEDTIIAASFGLLSPGKGIELAIRAIAEHIDEYPQLHYLIIGRTHPHIVKHQGEAYRDSLKQLVNELDITNNVHFVNEFVSEDKLILWIQSANFYICPPQNPQQASSGTLVYALGSGRATISTEFIHARDVVTENRGFLVGFDNHTEISKKIKLLLDDPKLTYRLGKNAYYDSRSWLWDNVVIKLGRALEEITEQTFSLKLPSNNLNSLLSRSDDIGLWQFGRLHEDDTIEGYTLDDNARAAIAMFKLIKNSPETIEAFQALNLLQHYLDFVTDAFINENSVHNYYTADYKPDFDRNSEENLDDALGRGLWCLGTCLSSSKLKGDYIDRAENLWLRLIERPDFIQPETSPRAAAFSGLGMIERLKNQTISAEERELLRSAINARHDKILDLYQQNADSEWQWYENIVSYANGVLVEFHIYAANLIGNRESKIKAINALGFLTKNSLTNSIPTPVGQDGWWYKNKPKTIFDQQPEEVAHLVLSCLAAYNVTDDITWFNHAKTFIDWFYGKNLNEISVYNRIRGTVYDGLTPEGVNLNEGAESLVMHLITLITYKSHEK